MKIIFLPVVAGLLAALTGCERLPEATVDRGGITFDFRALSDARFDGKGALRRQPAEDAAWLELSPHGALGGDFAVSAGQCGTLGFHLRRGKKFTQVEAKDRVGLLFRLTLPQGFEYVGSTFGDRKTLQVAAQKEDSTVYTVSIRGGFSLKWLDYHRMTALVRATGAVGTAGTGRLELLKNGEAFAAPVDFRLTTVPKIVAEKPSRYLNGLYSSGESTYFFGDETAEKGFAELLDATGVQWLIDERSDAKSRALWRAAGVKCLTPPIGIANAYWIPNGEIMKQIPESDRFREESKYPGFTYETSICPFAVIEERPFFRNVVVPKAIAAKLEGEDGSWVNWEPHMYEGRGCVCAHCQEEFAKWKAKTGQTDLHAFRSWVHGRYMKTLDKYVRQYTGGEKSVGLIAGVCWRACTTAWEKKLFSAEFKPSDYLADMEWFDPWGPYVYWDAEKALAKNEREPLWHWFFAKDMREQADRWCGQGRKTKLQAFPHAQQGRTWVTQPEHLGMAMDAFFFNRWEATVAYLFPQGYDARYWKAFADATMRAARCERFVWDGTRADGRVAVETVPEFAPRRKLVSDYVPSSANASLLQTAAYDLGGVRLVAALNFCDDVEAYFTLTAKDLGQKVRIVDENGVEWFRGDLSAGAFLMVGAARTKVFYLIPSGAKGPRATARLPQEKVRADYAARKTALVEAVAAGTAAREGRKAETKPKDLID